MNIEWAPEALQDLDSLRVFISEHEPNAAQRVALSIVHMVETTIAENPSIGRAGRVPGTRELIIPRTPFIVPYRSTGRALQILRVYHSARTWPDRF